MRARDYYRTEVVTARPDATVGELAESMADYAVGCIVIVGDEESPIGVVTDRDLTCRVIARGLAPGSVRARDVMSAPVLTAAASEPLEVVIERMRSAGVRRLPVVREGKLTGLVALDDLLVELGRELDDLGEAARSSVQDARRRARRERRREELEETLGEIRHTVEKAARDASDFLSREFVSIRERLRRSSGQDGGGSS